MSAPRIAEPSYAGIHRRLERDLGKASQHLCLKCGGAAAEWAYDHTDSDERVDDTYAYPRPYSLKPEHYLPLCVSCHRKFDNQDSCRKGHEFTEKNTYVYRGYRLCRTCRLANVRKHREKATNVR